MITPSSLARKKAGLDERDPDLAEFLAQDYDHAAQMRSSGDRLYPTSTRFDQDAT